MHLFSGTAEEFLTAVRAQSLVPTMRAEFKRQMFSVPSPSEVRSWEVSLAVVAEDVDAAGVPDAGVLVEHMLPLSSKRLDLFLFGRSEAGEVRPLVLELKQWTHADIEDVEGRLVVVAGNRLLLHPQQQVAQYVEYLRGFHPTLYAPGVELAGAAYLHNASSSESKDLREAAPPDLAEFPLLTGDDRDALRGLLASRLEGGDGSALLEEYDRTPPRPSKKLLEHVAEEVLGHPQFTLVDGQFAAYEAVRAAVEDSHAGGSKTVVIVTGGPGTGKSVIAARMLGDFAARGWNVAHATGSRSFTNTLRRVVSTKTRPLFSFFHQFSAVEPDSYDALICDEAHRIRETSNSRFTPKHQRSNIPQVDELVQAARVPVFLLDEHQVVRPGEIGTVAAIEDAADRADAAILTVELDGQFRCAGSERYINWVMNLLGLRGAEPQVWEDDDQFELAVADSPGEMEAWLTARSGGDITARIAAGFCWPWSDPTPAGDLLDDVIVGTWRRPWNAKPEKKVKLAPQSHYWASDERGFGQVGCIYTAQGFEYDYGGVIFGPDLVWRDGWQAVRSASEDPAVKRASDEQFAGLIVNTYKVLLTRSLQGGILYSVDPQTQALIRRLVPTGRPN